MSSAFPNEPNGFTSVYDVPFTQTLPSTMFNVYNTAEYANDATAPLSPPWVFDSYMAVGSATGNGQWGGTLPTRPREVFVGFWWKTNNDFQGLGTSNNKLFFVRAQTNSGDNSFMVWQGLPDSPKTLKWYQQGTVNNTHVPGAAGMNWPVDGTGWFEPNVNGAAATFNANSPWRRVEIYLKSSTTFTSRDGSIRIWVDGTLSTSHVNIVNISPNGFEDWQINHTWDGGPSPAARDLSRRWDHFFDHVYVSIPSTTGGGSTPVLQSLTPSTASLAPGNSQAYTVGMTAAVSTNMSVSLTSSSPAVITVPSSVTVNAGQATAGFTATAVAAGTSTITASLSGASQTSAVTVTTSSGGGGGTSNSTYTHTTQFSNTQSANGWSYRDTAGNLLAYNATSSLWENTTYPYLSIWANGCHPGYTVGSVLRWTAPSTGSARITGSVQDLDTTSGNGILFTVVYGASSTLYSKDLSGADAASYAYDVTQTMTAGDFIDFTVTAKADGGYDSTALNPVIVLTVSNGNPGAPIISSFTPTSGVRGSSVTVVGQNFNTTLTNNTVTVNGVQATVTSASSTQLVFTVPDSATTGSVMVTTSNGSATGGTYTVTDPITVVVPPASNFGGNAMMLLVMP